MGVVLFPYQSRATVQLQYLLLVEDWQRAGPYARGAAVLAYLYREMVRSVLHITHSSSSLGGDLVGWILLLQLWAWDRFPYLIPRHAERKAQITEDAFLPGVRWLPAKTRQYSDQLFLYKLWFDEMETMVVSI
ncbi:unnamed protein product [Linum tenue]|nr:unnamed protein product [Linum tenue]